MCRRSIISFALNDVEDVESRQQRSSLLQVEVGGGFGGCVGVADGLGFGLLAASGAATTRDRRDRREKRRINGYATRKCILDLSCDVAARTGTEGAPYFQSHQCKSAISSLSTAPDGNVDENGSTVESENHFITLP